MKLSPHNIRTPMTKKIILFVSAMVYGFSLNNCVSNNAMYEENSLIYIDSREIFTFKYIDSATD